MGTMVATNAKPVPGRVTDENAETALKVILGPADDKCEAE